MRNLYRVFYMNRFVTSFSDRERALEYVYSKPQPEDYEIRDNSDYL